MPGFSDLELQDLDLKPYMDPTTLLDTFSPTDMDMWHTYNFFSDENINSSLKDEIKEENIDMDCCFSSICPNDLINNINNLTENDIGKQIFYQNQNSTNDEAFSYEYSSSSSTSSSSSRSPNLDEMKASSINIDTFDFVPCMLQDGHNQNTNNQSDLILTPLGITQEYSINGNQHQNYDNESSPQIIEYQNEKLTRSTGQIYQIYQTNGIANNNSATTPILIVQDTKASNTVTNAQKSKLNKNTLPPSPPSSFGSDSESNQSSTSSAQSTGANSLNLSLKKSLLPSTKSTLIQKSSKHGLGSSVLKSATILKQIRHQPYSVKSSSSKQSKSGSSSLNTSKNSVHNNNCSNDDDDCWPFLCSLSKLPSSGPLMLTEEEKRTLVQEGHQVPSQLPLSKGEEKILKKIRRKIKNKISAQESRRKKKEYVDSLEKRMENYINENYELKKRLEDLELNNKSLLSQLEKMKASLASPSLSLSSSYTHSTIDSSSNINITDFNTCNSNTSNQSNQFGTLLMVMVLFFAVLLGVWSPVLSKDQLTHSAAVTASTIISGTSSRSASNSICSSPASSTAAAVAVVTAAASASVASFAAIKQQQDQCSSDSIDAESPSLKSRVMLSLNEDELMSFETGSASLLVNGDPSPNQFSSTARSKTGTAVELTKVRPFVRKLPTIQKAPSLMAKSTNQGQGQASDFIFLNNSNDDGQIIILNLANNNQHDSMTNGNNKGSSFTNNYRVINAASNQQQSSKTTSTSTSTSKLPTRFRVINNSSIGSTGFSQHSNVIKLSSA